MQLGRRAARSTLLRGGHRVVATALIAAALAAAGLVGIGISGAPAHASAGTDVGSAAGSITGTDAGTADASAPTASTAPTTVSAHTVSSNDGAAPTANDPWTIAVTTALAGDINIASNPTSNQNGEQPLADLTITAPTATAANPLHLTFQVFVGDLPEGSFPSDVQISAGGSAVAACPGAVVASPDPCVASVAESNGIATFTVLSSHASHWQLDAPVVGRLSGANRFATAVAASQAQFPSGGAGAVVLARADDYADALVGGPLAAQKNGPLLLTSGSTLPASTKTELLRVLSTGGRVYLLGGTSAIPASVESQLTSLGFQTTRLAGADRNATAVAVADALGDPATVLLATGTNYPDALAAGPAAAHVAGAVLLTSGATMPSETAAYLAAHAKTVYAVGGPAAAASPTAHAIVGADRFATAAAVAKQFFVAPPTFGVATGDNFPDALAAGALLAHLGAPLVLSGGASLPTVTAAYVTSIGGSATSAHVFGGAAAISESVRTAVGTALMDESAY
jgi:putative cell wall-binding protein